MALIPREPERLTRKNMDSTTFCPGREGMSRGVDANRASPGGIVVEKVETGTRGCQV